MTLDENELQFNFSKSQYSSRFRRQFLILEKKTCRNIILEFEVILFGAFCWKIRSLFEKL